ncbi:DUF523 domain-containing protein [Uliginosibacterium sp. sgz301328]|uniref:DUF523 domain-containing protein n=1 Tax=Uliginosibacterium sp. sgz301328 TaxID=3243764 RepID=UPI00359EBD8A
MHRILVSACLLGHPVRYHGRGAARLDTILLRWIEQGRVVAVCPEVAGGLPTPRPPAEIEPGGDGSSVWRGAHRVIDATGQDLTARFKEGADHAVRLAREHHVAFAVLKESSPSCGVLNIHDGHFSGRRVLGMGVVAARLAACGVKIFSDLQLGAAERWLLALQRGDDPSTACPPSDAK